MSSADYRRATCPDVTECYRRWQQYDSFENSEAVERLLAQNKASSDAWTRRTAKMESELAKLRNLMAEAMRLHNARQPAAYQGCQISGYGQAVAAQLIGLLREARECEALQESAPDLCEQIDQLLQIDGRCPDA